MFFKEFSYKQQLKNDSKNQDKRFACHPQKCYAIKPYVGGFPEVLYHEI
jgi:hypothetical protein